MNNNIILNVDGNTGKVTTNCTKIGNQLENLQKKIVFKMTPKIAGSAWMEYEIDGVKNYTILESIEDGYQTDIKSVLLTSTSVTVDLRITEAETADGIPVFVSDKKTFAVNETIQASTEEPEQYPTWYEEASAKIAEIDDAIDEVGNLDITAERVSDGVEVTITDKEGDTSTTKVQDGIGLDYDWSGTSLGIKREDEQVYEYVNLKGDKGDPGAIKINIVNQLPATGADDTIYLVPVQDPETGNNYEEYIYVNNQWEKLGGIQVEIDLTDYVKNTDYATSSKGGVIKSGYYGLQVDSNNGKAYCDTYTYANYGNVENQRFISKGTLENVITGKDLTTKSYVDGLVGDIATALDTIQGEVI